MRLWALWRRLLYGGAFTALLVFLGSFIYATFIFTPATCFDNIRNGNESGVDCGGGCIRICAVDVMPPQIIWAESFKITDGQYNAVAYVENRNQIAATPELSYTFTLKDGERVVAERSGTTILPPNSVYPIFEGRIFTEKGTAVTDTIITLGGAPLWLPATVGRDQFKATDINLLSADARPRLNVSIENTEVTSAQDVEVVATIFSQDGVPVTASQTYIESIAPRTTEDIVFTWPRSIAKTVRSCVVPTDVVLAIDVSGSMNNDGGTPPQPITAALLAAGTFVENLNEKDQAAVVTFASNAAIVASFSNQHEDIAQTIRALTIDPKEETGFTNTTAALRSAQEELNSERHNEDARRVLVLLTDGLPTAPGDDDALSPALSLAATLHTSDIEMYAIGLGENVDTTFIHSLVEDEKNAYFAPSSEDLASIYSTITAALCETGPTKIDVIAKTKTNFTPLR